MFKTTGFVISKKNNKISMYINDRMVIRLKYIYRMDSMQWQKRTEYKHICWDEYIILLGKKPSCRQIYKICSIHRESTKREKLSKQTSKNYKEKQESN